MPKGSDFRKTPVDESVLLDVLADVVHALESRHIPYASIGGIASVVLGRTQHTDDIDVLVHPHSAKAALDCLAEAGFDTQEPELAWLYKAKKRDVLVDIIFRSTGEILLDEEMIERSHVVDFRGQPVRIVAPEDLVVTKALAYSEDTPHYWFDALATLRDSEIDWEYLLARARNGPRRVLALLIYAQSIDLPVPEEPLRRLFELIYGQGWEPFTPRMEAI